jgi:hypothetical protein
MSQNLPFNSTWCAPVLVAVLGLGGCASVSRPTSPPPATPLASSEEPLEVIDAHIHTDFDGAIDRGSKVLNSREGLAAEMKANHVVGAVAHAHADDRGYADLSELNVIHCAGMGPTVDAKRLEADLASGKYRCIKIYLGYVPQWASDLNYEPAYRLAEKFHVPVVFHTGDTDSRTAKLKYADPLTLDEVAVDHPNVTFVLAHCGNPWIESAAEVAYKNPNVYLDGSAFVIGDLSQVPPEVMDAYVVKPLRWMWGYIGDPRKLMFGTDWPLVQIGPYLQAFKRAIPKEHWRAVFHDNAARVFGFQK